MLSKCEKLVQRIGEVREFVSSRTDRDGTLASIHQELDTLTQTLSSGKPVLKAIACELTTASALQNLLFSSNKIASTCQIELATLPDNPEEAASASPEVARLGDGDILCSVVGWQQVLADAQQWLVEQASQANASQLAIVLEIPKSDRPTPTQIATRVAEIEEWMRDRTSMQSFEVVALELASFYPDAGNTNIDPDCQKVIDKFVKSLEGLVRRKPEDLLAKRLMAKVLEQFARVEAFLETEDGQLQQEIRQTQKKRQSLKSGNSNAQLKEQWQQVRARIDRDKNQFFQQIESERKQSIAQLTDRFYRKSIVYQLQAFIDSLQPRIVKRGGSKYVQLRSANASGSSELNIDLMHLCYSHLSQWSISEWQRIYTSYAEGGVNQFLQRTQTALNSIPHANLNLSFSPLNSDYLPFSNGLKDLAVGINCESQHKDVFMLTYLLKQIRSQWMSFTFLLTGATMFGLSNNKRDLISSQMENLRSMMSQNPLMMMGALTVILCSLFLLLFYNYCENDRKKLEVEGAKLKKDLNSYYKDFVKSGIEKLTQDFNLALKAEAANLDRTIEYVDKQVSERVLQGNRSQHAIESHYESLQEQKKELAKVKSEFAKLKRI